MRARVMARRLNVRAAPRADGRWLGALSRDAVVDLLGERGNWREIRFEGTPAFLHANYLETLPEPEPLRGLVRASRLNVRAAPGGGAPVVGGLVKGSAVDILGEQGDWLEIGFNGATAYVHGDYVSRSQPARRERVRVRAEWLNVRAAPDAAGQLLGQLPRGAEFAIVARHGDWLELRFNDATAFVRGDFVGSLPRAGDDSPAAPVAGVQDPDEAIDLPPLAAELDEPADSLDRVPLAAPRPLRAGDDGREIAVASTWNRYGGLLDKLCGERDIDPGCAVAVLCVESAGRGFDAANRQRMVLRFENHKFWKYWGRDNAAQFQRHFRFGIEDESGRLRQTWKRHEWRERTNGRWRKFHGDQAEEWKVLGFARSLDDSAALMSISMGAPQIMGFHYKTLGFDTVQDMFEQFSGDIRYHIIGLFDFFDSRMTEALRRQDFETFAGYYNGSGQKQRYGRLIDDHFHAWRRLGA